VEPTVQVPITASPFNVKSVGVSGATVSTYAFTESDAEEFPATSYAMTRKKWAPSPRVSVTPVELVMPEWVSSAKSKSSETSYRYGSGGSQEPVSEAEVHSNATSAILEFVMKGEAIGFTGATESTKKVFS